MNYIKKIKTGLLLCFAVTLLFSACTETELVPVDLDIAPGKEFAITNFDIAGSNSIALNEDARTILVKFPCGTDVTNVTPDFDIPSGATVVPAAGTAVNLSSPVEYTVTNGNLFRTYRVSSDVQCIVGFLSHHPDRASIIDDDEAAAAAWFFDTYDDELTRFVSFQAIKDDPSILNELKVLWWILDGHPETRDFWMPDLALDPDVLSAITDWYKAGGNIYLYQYACRYIFELGRQEAIPGLNANLATGVGDGSDNPDTWGTGITPGLVHDMKGHPIFSGIPIDTRPDDGMNWIKTMSPGWREDRNFMIGDMQVAYGLGDTDEEVYQRFTTENQLVWLGSWEWTGANYFVVGMLEYLPNDEYQGRAIFQGQGGFEFNMNAAGVQGSTSEINPEGKNAYQQNLNSLAKNAIDYLIVN